MPNKYSNSSKSKTHKRKSTTSNTKHNRQISNNLRSDFANFELNRLTLAGWILSLLSACVFLIGAGIAGSSLENAGVKQASRGEVKVLGFINLVVVVVFFLSGKWMLKKFDIKIFKD
jgi:uncharacterized membrane protein YtjA (UPF0391 family)